jgi:cold shock CspA family protein
MTNDQPEQAAPPSPEAGIVRWFDPIKKIGIIARPDGSTIFIPAFGLAEGQGALSTGQPVSFVVRENAKGRYAAKVVATDESPLATYDTALQLAAELHETASPALAQLRRIIRHLGLEAAQRYVAEAQRVEAAGGMLLPDGSRRRTLGGVFFMLVRDSLPDEQREIVFPPFQVWKAKKAKHKKEASNATQDAEPPPAPPLTWDDRIARIAELRAHSGKATTVKVTIIGRPNQIEERPQVTLLTLTHSGPLPALPKGVPTPDPVPATIYSIYIGKKQWKAVAEALANPEDMIIVEGTQVLDAATGTINVFATKTTTKLLQQTAKAGQARASDSPPATSS